jgi:glutamine synthetase
MGHLEDWVTGRRIDEVECLIPDMSGIAQGKILPAEMFLCGLEHAGLRLPESVFQQTVTGDCPPAALSGGASGSRAGRTSSR